MNVEALNEGLFPNIHRSMAIASIVRFSCFRFLQTDRFSIACYLKRPSGLCNNQAISQEPSPCTTPLPIRLWSSQTTMMTYFPPWGLDFVAINKSVDERYQW